MSVETMAIVLHHSRAKGTDKVILLGIANHDGDGGAWPSIETLSKYANVDERNVQRAIDRIVEAGELLVEVKGGGQRDGRYRTNRYTVLVTCPLDCDGTKNHRSRGGADAIAENPEVARPTSRGGAGARSEVARTPPEPSLEPPAEPPLFACASDDAVLSASFEDLWKVYPRREDKKAARAVWAAMKPADRRAAIDAAPGWVAAHDPKFAPYLCRWLRNRRWEDETAPKVNGHQTSSAVADRALISDLADMVLNFRHRGMDLFVQKHGPFPDRLWGLYESTYPDPVYRIPVAPDVTVAS